MPQDAKKPTPILRFAGFTLDRTAQELRGGGRVLDVWPQSFELLCYLIDNRERIVSKREILAELWPGLTVTPTSLTTCVSRLRSALGPKGAMLIKTVYGQGYRFTGVCRSGAAASEVEEIAPTLLGRANEVSEIRSFLAGIGAGGGGLLLLAGQQGIGKTALVAAALELAANDGLRTLSGICVDGARTPAFWPWTQVLRQYAQEIGAERFGTLVDEAGSDLWTLLPDHAPFHPSRPRSTFDDVVQARARLFESASKFFSRATREQPLLVCIEDLHWADPGSIALLQAVTSPVPAGAVGFIATQRDDDSGAAGLAGSLQRLGESGGSRSVSVHGLAGDAVNRLAARIARRSIPAWLSKDLLRYTSGNPLFVAQLVRHLNETGRLDEAADGVVDLDIPLSIRHLIEERLDRLPSACRHMLALAAILATSLSLRRLSELWIRLAEDGDGASVESALESVERAVAAGILEPETVAASTYRFSHEIWRTGIYANIPRAIRSQMHRAAGELLEEEPPSTTNLPLLAGHFFRSATPGSAEKASRYAELAGDHANQAMAYERAAELYQQAIDAAAFAADADRRRQAELAVSAAEMTSKFGTAAQTMQAVDQAIARARAAGAPDLLARAAIAPLQPVLPEIRRQAHFIPRFQEALDALPADDSALRAKLLCRLAWEHYSTDTSGDQTTDLTAQALAITERLGDPDTRLSVLIDHHRVRAGPVFAQERATIAAELIDLATTLRASEPLAVGLTMRVRNRAEIGQLDEAAADVAQVARLNEELRLPYFRWVGLMWRTMHALLIGQLDIAENAGQQGYSLRDLVYSDFSELYYGSQRSLITLHSGELDAAHEFLQLAVKDFPHLPAVRGALAVTMLLVGKEREAAALADQCLPDRRQRPERRSTWLPTMQMLGFIYAALGDAERCEHIYDELLPYESMLGLIGAHAAAALGATALPLGVLARALGRSAASEKHLAHAIQQHERLEAQPWTALSYYELGRCLIDRGSTNAAADAMGRARRIAGQVAMHGLVTSVNEAEADNYRSAPTNLFGAGRQSPP